MRTTPIVMMLCALFVQCATLNSVAANTCGNGVLEAGEDCDSSNNTCGAPAAGPQACHFVCATSTDCAAGASCSADGVCRRPAGSFASVTAGVSANVSTLLAGDFDGDKRTDIIGSPPYGSAGSSRIHYFDADNSLATTTPLDLPIPLATVKDLDHDGLADLGFAIRNLGFGAFGALKGQRDRTFATVLYPAVTFAQTDARWTVVTNSSKVKLPGTAPSCAFGVLTNDAGGRVLSVCDGSTGDAGAFSLPVGIGPDDLVGDPHAGVINASSGCGHLVFTTSKLVYVLPLCTKDGSAWLDGDGAAPSVLDPHLTGDTITGLYVGAVTAVGADDILIRTAQKNEYVYDLNTFKPAAGLASAVSLPLASGDLNGDNVVDFVFPNGIALSAQAGTIGDAGTAATRVAPRDNLAWKYARIGRFNDDELPDVLVSFDGQLDVDVLGNAGDGRFTPFTVRTDQIVRGIGAGDFDGDRIDDVAFLQSTDPTDNGPADLFIAFGSATGAPEAAHLVGSLKNAHALMALKDSSIGVDDLSVVGTATGAQSSLTVLFGTGGRTQVAPLFMLDPAGDSQTSGTGKKVGVGGLASGGGLGKVGSDQTAHYWQPASFSIGPFINPGPLQIVSIAAGYDYTPAGATPYGNLTSAAWYAAHDDNAVGNLVPFVEATALGPFVSVDLAALESGKFELWSVTASGDIDYPVAAGQEVDELVTLTKSTIDPTQAAVFVVHPGVQTVVPGAAARIPNAVVAGSDAIQIVDLDGDHDPDVVFILTADGVRKLMIMRGDGKGNFDAPTAIAVPTDAETFAVIDTGKAHLELAVVTPTKVVLASLDGVTDISPGIHANYTGITVGDFNGDGVQDIALADGGLIRLLPQRYVGEQ